MQSPYKKEIKQTKDVKDVTARNQLQISYFKKSFRFIYPSKNKKIIVRD